MLRNQLVHYLKLNKVVSDPIDNYIPILPEPINHHNACSKCPYITACSAILRLNNHFFINNYNIYLSTLI